MDLSEDGTREALCDRLGAVFRDRPVIVGVGPAAGFTNGLTLLRQAGARRPLLLASGRGAGPVPADEDARTLYVDVPPSESMTAELRAQDAFVRALPEHVVAEIEAYDPAGAALWLVGPFISDAPILGRPVIGGRPAAWAALEDKLVVDAIWDAVGAPHAEHATVPCDRAALAGAAARLDAGAGTVWAGDARDGFNGGGDFVRWVATEADAAAAHAFFAPRCDRVRVMPFLDGVPCSVHGMVLPTGTAAFRPMELAILRGPGRRFVYGGQGTTWSPPPADRAQMRDLVRRTGEHLRTAHGYAGGFGIDGILTADGFRPTELNARLSAGLASLARVVDTRLFTLLQLALAGGAAPDADPGVTAEDLEGWALPQLDARPFLKVIAMAPDRVLDEAVVIPVSWDGRTLRRDDAGAWAVEAAPSPAGTFARIALPETPADDGQRVADLNVALMRFLDAELGTRFGAVTAAPDVRDAAAEVAVG
ncbi:MAG: hypothetical protein ACXVW9_18255 [Nocardioidaceae bacterium]